MHSIATPLTRGEFRCVYSFATKFASFHRPQAFAIYDEYVDSVLWEYALQYRFSRFQRNQLRIYPEFSRSSTTLSPTLTSPALLARKLTCFYGYMARRGRANTAAAPRARVTNSMRSVLNAISDPSCG